MQEFAGYALTTDTSHELAVWLYGPPGSGKSTFLAGLQTMLGARAGLLGLAEIERSRFALGNVSGKTLLVSTEQPSGYLAAGHILNALISGEPMEIERKYRDSYNIVPQAKIAWAMNETPRVSDASSGLFRRVKVVEFPELLPLERDPQVKVSIATEGAGILNWALEGLARLHEREYFEVPQCVQDSTDEFQRTNDVAALFVEEACIVGHEFRAEPSRLYDAYREWADDNGYAKKNSTNIAADWKRLGFRKGKVMGKRYWNGVGLRIDYPIS